jgi:hypothetical protein
MEARFRQHIHAWANRRNATLKTYRNDTLAEPIAKQDLLMDAEYLAKHEDTERQLAKVDYHAMNTSNGVKGIRSVPNYLIAEDYFARYEHPAMPNQKKGSDKL